jgi:DNA-binding LytR/AlgR family response regulator
VKAFEVNALDYLLKPFDKKRLKSAIEKARGLGATPPPSSEKLDKLVEMLEAQKPQPSKILLKSAGRLFLVDQKDICFASIEDGVITVVAHHMEGQSNCRTLEELASALDANLFWRAHRSYLVNINRIKEVVPGSSQLPDPHGRQEADGNPGQPRPNQAVERVVRAIEKPAISPTTDWDAPSSAWSPTVR